MTMSLLLRKLRLENREFVMSRELEAYCRNMKLHYPTVVRYFASRGYLVRILRGIFYVKSLEELKLGRNRYNHLQLVAKSLELKNVETWYFGLHSALKLNNMTHEHFGVEDVISESLFRAKPVNIAGYRFKFTKVSPSLLRFGILKENMIRFSDPEKTILDFIYLWRQNGIPAEKIVADVGEWAKDVSKVRLRKYAAAYPKTVAEIARRVVR